MGLLLLRAAVGITVVVQGSQYLLDRNTSVGGLCIGLTLALSGLSILVGLFTPIASATVALLTAATGLSWLRTPATNLLDTPLPLAFVIVVAVAVGLLGPGSLSLDHRLFGRREIIIPRTPGLSD